MTMFVVKSEWLVDEAVLLAAFVMKNVWSLALRLLSCSVSEGLITFSQQLFMDSLSCMRHAHLHVIKI